MYSLNLYSQNKPPKPNNKECPLGQIKQLDKDKVHWKCVDEVLIPVTLLYFKAQVYNDSIVLYWSTATEVNNDYFIIEGSNDGRLFTSIVRVSSICSNSNSQLYYHSKVKPYKYYRLMQVDLDGSKTIYSIIFVYFKEILNKEYNKYNSIGQKIK